MFRENSTWPTYSEVILKKDKRVPKVFRPRCFPKTITNTDHKVRTYDFKDFVEEFFSPVSKVNEITRFEEEGDDEKYYHFELPGFKESDINITCEDGVLHIKEKRKKPSEKEYETSIKMSECDENKIDASLSDGILTVTLQKKEELKPRKIPINN